jgi:hypothetical protein
LGIVPAGSGARWTWPNGERSGKRESTHLSSAIPGAFSSSPMIREGVKTAVSDDIVNTKFMDRHLRIGIDSLTELINNGLTVKHLRF